VLDLNVYKSDTKPTWCPGCGDFAVLSSLMKATQTLQLEPWNMLIVSGIGCSSNFPHFLSAYGFHGIHGRSLPVASGAKLANPELTVIAAGGDGDGYAIGVGHLVHTFRRNPALTYVLMNNATYGLTKGQGSPTAPLARPDGDEQGLDGILLGLAIMSSTFLARGYSGRPEQLVRLLGAGLDHARGGGGFAFVEVLSPCVTYQDTYPIWEAAVYDLDEEPGYDPSDRAGAYAACLRVAGEGRIPIGMIYRGGRHGVRPDPAPASVDLNGLEDAYRAIMDAYRV